jgi:hypothetical protein
VHQLEARQQQKHLFCQGLTNAWRQRKRVLASGAQVVHSNAAQAVFSEQALQGGLAQSRQTFWQCIDTQ